MNRDRAKTVIDEALHRGRNALSEHESKEVLTAYGIPVTAERLVGSVAELEAALPEFQLPVVLKIDSPDILHKTEAGLVALDCRTVQDASAEAARILDQAAERYPQALVNGVLLQEQITGAVAECIVGMKKDPQFGPIVLFGLGGIFVEVLGDVALRVAPLAKDDAREMIRETKGFRVLAGARGRPKADLEALADMVLKLSALSLDLEPYLSEVDLNPVLVRAEGAPGARPAVAADALILLDTGGAAG